MIIKKMMQTLAHYESGLSSIEIADLASIRLLKDIDDLFNIKYSMCELDKDEEFINFVNDDSFDRFESTISICPVRHAMLEALHSNALVNENVNTFTICTRLLYIADRFLELRPQLFAEMSSSNGIKRHFEALDRSSNYLKFLRKKNAI